MNTTNTTNDNNQTAGNDLSLSLSLSLSEERERERSRFFLYARVDLFLSLLKAGRFSKLLFRVTNETLTQLSALFFHSTRKENPSKPRARIEELLALLGKSSSSRRRCCCSEEEEEEEKGVLFNPFLSKTLAFLAREAETRKHHKNHAHLFLAWFLKFKTKRKHYIREEETPPPRRRRRSAAALLLVLLLLLLLLLIVVVIEKGESHRREREVDEELNEE